MSQSREPSEESVQAEGVVEDAVELDAEVDADASEEPGLREEVTGEDDEAPVVDDAEPAEDSDEEDSDEDDEEDVDPLDEEGDIAADYLEELLDIADLDGDIDTYVEGGRPHVSIVTDSQTLVGRDGNVLEALQELSRLAVMTEVGHRSRLMLDVAGYRETRRKELVALATEAIQAVKETGEPEHLSPMNPFERKIVHDAVAAAGLHSESEGVEPRRHVVISSR